MDCKPREGKSKKSICLISNKKLDMKPALLYLPGFWKIAKISYQADSEKERKKHTSNALSPILRWASQRLSLVRVKIEQ